MLKITSLLILILCNVCQAGLFGDKKTPLAEFNAFKANVAENAFKDADALVKLSGKVDKLEMRVEADAKVNASAQAGVNNKLNQVNETVGGNKNTTNDTEMIKKMIEENKNIINKLIGTYQFIINVLIVQLCALLTLFIKKDWDSQRRASDREAKNDDMQMKLIEKALDEEIAESEREVDENDKKRIDSCNKGA